jgi:hypothetical protein
MDEWAQDWHVAVAVRGQHIHARELGEVDSAKQFQKYCFDLIVGVVSQHDESVARGPALLGQDRL